MHKKYNYNHSRCMVELDFFLLIYIIYNSNDPKFEYQYGYRWLSKHCYTPNLLRMGCGEHLNKCVLHGLTSTNISMPTAKCPKQFAAEQKIIYFLNAA